MGLSGRPQRSTTQAAQPCRRAVATQRQCCCWLAGCCLPLLPASRARAPHQLTVCNGATRQRAGELTEPVTPVRCTVIAADVKVYRDFTTLLVERALKLERGCVGARRPFHLSVFLTASRMVLPKILLVLIAPPHHLPAPGPLRDGAHRGGAAAGALPSNIRREGGNSLVLEGSSLVILESRAGNPL